MKRVFLSEMPEGDAKKLLLLILRKFSSSVRDSLPELDDVARDKSVIELWECGFLKITGYEDGFQVELCDPNDAPQLNGKAAFQVS